MNFCVGMALKKWLAFEKDLNHIVNSKILLIFGNHPTGGGCIQ